MGSNEIVSTQYSAVLHAAHSAANGKEKYIDFNLLSKNYEDSTDKFKVNIGATIG